MKLKDYKPLGIFILAIVVIYIATTFTIVPQGIVGWSSDGQVSAEYESAVVSYSTSSYVDDYDTSCSFCSDKVECYETEEDYCKAQIQLEQYEAQGFSSCEIQVFDSDSDPDKKYTIGFCTECPSILEKQLNPGSPATCVDPTPDPGTDCSTLVCYDVDNNCDELVGCDCENAAYYSSQQGCEYHLDDLTCPSVCVPLYELIDGTCSLNDCGSGCGANDLFTFDTEQECLDASGFDGPGGINPATTFCLDNGGTLLLANSPDGGQYSTCEFGGEYGCEENDYYCKCNPELSVCQDRVIDDANCNAVCPGTPQKYTCPDGSIVSSPSLCPEEESFDVFEWIKTNQILTGGIALGFIILILLLRRR